MIAIVCDATGKIGYGHLKRCLVLACRYQNLGLGVTFVMREAAPVVQGLLKDRGMELVVLSGHDRLVPYLVEQKDRIQLVILDHYEINADLEKQMSAVLPVVVVDDLCRPHWCDVLVDPTPDRKAGDYETKLYQPSVRTLLGTDYTLIDPVYTGIKTNGDKTNILISFGATDPGKAGLKVLDILESSMATKGLIFHLPLSSLSPCISELKIKRDNACLDIRLYQDLPDLCSLYEICGMAIGAPGTSLLERIYCGLINIAIVAAPNQREVGKNLARMGAALCLGEISNLEPDLLTRTLAQMIDDQALGKSLQAKAMGLVDGKGAIRVIKQTIDLISPVSLRPARKTDLDRLYAWQHEPGARKYSRNTCLPAKKEHQDWFDRVLSSRDIQLYIIHWCRTAIGYIRLDTRGNEEEVSILIAQRFQGHGFAKNALQQILAAKKRAYTAVVHPENKASIGLFNSVGFQCKGNGEYVFNSAGTRLHGN